MSGICTYLINLDRDAARLAHMQAEAARAGLTLMRIPAVYGLAMPDWLKPFFLDASGAIASQLRRGEVGCYASHLVAAQRIRDEGHAYALVLEDDLDIAADFGAVLAAALAAMPQGWDILRLSNPPKAGYLTLAGLPGGADLALYARVPNNTGAYLLSAAGARKLLAPGLRRLQIDEDLRRPWLRGMETFGIVPPPIRSNIFDTSTIDAMGERGLGREGLIAKFRRRHWDTPAMLARQWIWQIRHLGVAGFVQCMLKTAQASLHKRFFVPGTQMSLQQRFRAGSSRPRARG